ncbi:pyrimidine-nucleoside phosphorylase [Pillotina sp. SPG140]|jgi:pyrimidine-nucleoside phosphorylase
MHIGDLIMKKRSGHALSADELTALIDGYVKGTVPAYQVSAWAMAVFFQGMTAQETADLMHSMIESGSSIDFSGYPGPFVDKHSTGGVGDKTSLILAPLVASLGVYDPMMSGRALGHTGGTLDKLEAIPGYRTHLSVEEFRSLVVHDGFAMMGQTEDIVPADRLLYALRDVTATVESIPLITASILAKKKAEGTNALVLDVKYGSGAFMHTVEKAEQLAQALVDTARACGIRVCAVISNMDEPLGTMTGNFVEVEEALACLEGRGPADLMEVTLSLAAQMLILAGKAPDVDCAIRLCTESITSGKARALFLTNIAHQGGDVPQFLALIGTYRSSTYTVITAEQTGFIGRIHAGKVGHAGVALGIGRENVEDSVWPTAGIQFHKKHGDTISKGEPVMTVWARNQEGLEQALPLLHDSIEYSTEKPAPLTMIFKIIP